MRMLIIHDSSSFHFFSLYCILTRVIFSVRLSQKKVTIESVLTHTYIHIFVRVYVHLNCKMRQNETTFASPRSPSEWHPLDWTGLESWWTSHPRTRRRDQTSRGKQEAREFRMFFREYEFVKWRGPRRRPRLDTSTLSILYSFLPPWFFCCYGGNHHRPRYTYAYPHISQFQWLPPN